MSKRNLSVDQNHLKDHSYKTDEKLNTRIRTHQLYTEPNIPFYEFVLDTINWAGTERVIDVGCGSGFYAEPATARASSYIAADLSMGMLTSLNPNLPRINLDVQQLPLPEQCADVVLANHMLYHLPSIPAGIAEIYRILRPGGYLIAATNSRQSMQEFKHLRKHMLEKAGLANDPHLLTASLPFTMEDGREQLEPFFDHIELKPLKAELVFPEPQPIIDYLNSSRDWYDVYFADSEIRWEGLIDYLRIKLEQHFASHDDFRVNKHSGVFVCKK